MAVITVFACVIMTWVPFSKGQDETLNATLTESYIYSPGYFTGGYENDVRYDYLITTPYINHTIIFTMPFCEMEEFIEKYGCQDWMDIYDGIDDQAAVLVGNFCCQTTSLSVNQSTGTMLYLVFQSDDDVGARGFKMSFISDGPITNDTVSNVTAETISIWNIYMLTIVGGAYGGLNLILCVICLGYIMKKPAVKPVGEPDLIGAA